MVRKSRRRKSRKLRGSGRKKLVMTRQRRATLKANRKKYRKRVKANNNGCRKLITVKCRNKTGCKMALGKKRSFCRRSGKNRKL